jgi:hypothetical protein
LRIQKSEQAETVHKKIQDKASGVFMWIVLVVNIINQEYDRGRRQSLEQKLHQLPTDLNDLFQDILTQDSRNEEELVLCIQWVLYARQPLTPEQLYFALRAREETPTDAVKP